MSQLSSPPKNVLGSPKEIEPVNFYLSHVVPSPIKSSTFPLVTETSCLTPLSPYNLNNPTNPSQPGPLMSTLSNYFFEGDLPEHRHSESNILVASENMVIESLTQMRDSLRNVESNGFGEISLENTEPIFDKMPKVRLPVASDSEDTDEDNAPLKWVVQKRMVHVSVKEKEKDAEKTPKRKLVTRATNKKFMGDAMKSNKATTEENGKKEKGWYFRGFYSWIRTSGGSKVVAATSEKAKEPTKRKAKGKSTEKMEAMPVVKNKVLGGRVLYPTIIRKPGMTSLADLVEIQSWTHLFMTKSLVMHEDQVREFYYNVKFNGDGSLHTLVGDKRVQLNEELLGEILEVPIEGIISVAGKHCTQHFANDFPNFHTCIVQGYF
ncbi:hypothetical protein H5410_041882 [Solanum commersonii]|uniref:Uncharacterized protein n=1 Tax=Solanum commersonii TaxID=4109 RepID=A0A9J5XW05_SOLCO|nr:hypothetical protein H5410_041882 [Solanum commersonii]